MAGRQEPDMRGKDDPTRWLEIHRIDDPLSAGAAGLSTCQWRRYDCQSPTAYRLRVAGEDRSFLMCWEHMRELATILGLDPPPEP